MTDFFRLAIDPAAPIWNKEWNSGDCGVDIREEGGKVVVVLRDEDIIGEHMVRSTSDELCQLVYGGARYLIVDLKETSFVGSSSVLAMFITLHKLLATAEGAFVLRNPSAQTEELLRITRLSAILDVERGEGTKS